MNFRPYILFTAVIVFTLPELRAQGNFSGDLMINGNSFMRDTTIGASGNPLYDNLLTGGEGWLNLDYSNSDYNLDAGIRLDFFYNSNLHDPQVPYSNQGLGIIWARKKIGKLTITGGDFYDQYGSGMIFRAYEDRTLGIDKAIFGLNLQYELNKYITLKAFAGKQKNRFSFYEPFIKGANAEGFFSIKQKVQLVPGLAVVNRTMDQASMNNVVTTLESYSPSGRFVPKYNVTLYSAYNTLTFPVGKNNISWFAEYAGKTNEATPYSLLKTDSLVNKAGSSIYSTLTVSRKGFGITGQVRRTDYFSFRTSPNETLLDGVINYLPPVNPQLSYRLPARYSPSALDISELGYSVDVTVTPVKGYIIQLNYTNINELDNTHLFTNAMGEIEIKPKQKWTARIGGQYLQYNQPVYQLEGDTMITAITPFAEFVYKINRKHSFHIEAQYMSTKQDYGSWAYGSVEYDIAPKWGLAISDMYNVDPLNPKYPTKTHYYSVFGSYTKDANRFTIAYVKQVSGIVCTGGVCRFEPAFSGIKIGITSTF